MLRILPKPPPEEAHPLSRLLFVNATKQAQYGLSTMNKKFLGKRKSDKIHSSTVKKPYQARLATLAKNSRARGGVPSGGGFGRMFRIAWYSAKQPGAQPSGTFSCQ
jgi:hypothetical protein